MYSGYSIEVSCQTSCPAAIWFGAGVSVGGRGVNVGVFVGVPGVAEAVGVRVGGSVGLGVGVKVDVTVGVRVGVKVTVGVGVGARNMSPNRLGMLQARRKIPNQASRRMPGPPFQRERMIQFVTVTYYTVKARQTNAFALRMACQVCMRRRDQSLHPAYTFSNSARKSRALCKPGLRRFHQHSKGLIV